MAEVGKAKKNISGKGTDNPRAAARASGKN
jgi:hypothetical protein